MGPGAALPGHGFRLYLTSRGSAAERGWNRSLDRPEVADPSLWRAILLREFLLQDLEHCLVLYWFVCGSFETTT